MTHPLAHDLSEILEITRDLWEPLRGESIFITGGTGFVGTWLTESLVWADQHLDLGVNLTILTRDPEKFRDKAPSVANYNRVQLLKGDSTNFPFPAGRFRYVIHAATETQTAPGAPFKPSVGLSGVVDSPTPAFDRDLQSTRRILDFARQAGTKRLLFTSSGAIYGTQPADLTGFPEDYVGAPSTTDPKSSYGQAKRASEFLCAMNARQFGFDALIARLFAFVGPHLPLEGYAVGNFMRDAMNGQPIRIESDGSTVRSYLYAADLAIWLWMIFLRGESCRPYNVGSPHAIAVRDLAHAVATVAATNSRVEILGRPSVPATRYVPDTTRAETELGLRTRVPLDQALQRTLEWHRTRAVPALKH